MRILGVDPGKDGGAVILDEAGVVIAKEVMFLNSSEEFDPVAYEAFIQTHGPVNHAFVELVHAIHKTSAKTMFNFGQAFMFAHLLPRLLKIPMTLVPPKQWQKVIHVGVDMKLPAKERSLIIFNRQYPGLDVRRTERCKTQHDGMIDALHICEFGRRTLLGVQNGKV